MVNVQYTAESTLRQVEADWPDAYRVSRFVGATTDKPSGDASADEALADFQRFPKWMWRNNVVRDFVAWMNEYNSKIDNPVFRKGWYGLDLYSLFTSTAEVLKYLDTIDAEAAAACRVKMATLGQFADDPADYARALYTGQVSSQERKVIELLQTLLKHRSCVIELKLKYNYSVNSF